MNCIKANANSHSQDKKVAYFTEDRIYALVCCRKREENFVTMGLREDGKQHYFERFPNQLETMYKNKEGYLYELLDNKDLVHTKGCTWESDKDVIIHRYAEIAPEEQKMHANYIRDYLGDETQNKEYREFLVKHFSPLWD